MLYVALGRNVGDVPMVDETWLKFQEDVENCVTLGERLGHADTRAVGESNFGGMPEETFVLVWFDKNSPLRFEVVEALSYYAEVYGQESIAWSVSETQFILGVS